MVDVALFLQKNNLRVEQVQEFTPTPGSLATCLYHTGKDPFTGESVHVPRNSKERQLQKSLLLWHLPESRQDVSEALRICHREELLGRLRRRPDNKQLKENKPKQQRKRPRKKP